MSLFASKTGIALDVLVNRRLFPALILTVVLATYVPNVITYYTMCACLPQEQLDMMRHTTHLVWILPSVTVGIAILAIRTILFVINRYVTRPTIRMASWAERCYTGGLNEPIRVTSRVVEIKQLVTIFDKVFGDLVTSLDELNKIVHTMRHNLASPLNAVNGAGADLEKEECNNTKVAECLFALVKTITHILDCNAGIATNRCRLGIEPPRELFVSNLVHECLDATETLADAKGVELQAEWDHGNDKIVAHHQQIGNILHNLVDNAIKYTPAGGSVHLTVKAETDGLSIRVADTGIGIPEADRVRIYGRSFRASNVGDAPGTGDGLALVKSAVDFYRGSIDFSSNTPSGTVFLVKLPIKTSISRS